MNYYLLIIYFFAGILSDFLFTINMRYIAKERVLLSAIVAFITTITGLYILYSIITMLQQNRGFIAILVYAMGVGTGTYIAMRLKLEK